METNGKKRAGYMANGLGGGYKQRTQKQKVESQAGMKQSGLAQHLVP